MKKTILICCLAFLASCTSTKQEEFQQLSDVAKGWCLTIRASQVIPVYPLTEDVEVGDMFIVQKPLEDEVYEYESNGFLPLGQCIWRQPQPGLGTFYKGGTAINPNMPGIALTQSGGAAANPANPGAAPNPPAAPAPAPANPPPAPPDQNQYWTDLPLAAFPSYSFSIDKSSGFDAQIPIKGIPVALGLLGADSAAVTVTLSDARTYGLDDATLDASVRTWAKNPDNAKLLERFAPRYTAPKFLMPIIPGGTDFHKQYNYLRVVTRVYFIGAVNVSVTNTSESADDLRLANPPPLTLLNPDPTSTTTMPSVTLSNTTTADASKQPAASMLNIGGQLQVSSRTNSSITLNETFTRPMAIGYLAFDLPIGEDGQLGDSPVSTQVRLFDLGGGLSETLVAKWADNDPTAETKLDDWLKSSNNTGLANDLLKGDLSGKTLRKYLVDHAPGSWLYYVPIVNWIYFLDQENPLYSAIAEDVIRRPPGLPQPTTQPSVAP